MPIEVALDWIEEVAAPYFQEGVGTEWRTWSDPAAHFAELFLGSSVTIGRRADAE